jgi:hypothetical protein
MYLNGDIVISDSTEEVRKSLMLQWLPILNKGLRKAKKNIEFRTKLFLAGQVINSDTYKALNGGELQGHFGLRPSELQEKLRSILLILAESVVVTVTPLKYAKRITGGLEISAFSSDFGELINSDAGKVVTEKGQTLPWLDWLLTKGDRIIISDYSIHFQNNLGRSQQAIMVESSSGFWRVPPQYAGTSNDNWITRICDEESTLIQNGLNDIIISELENVL